MIAILPAVTFYTQLLPYYMWTSASLGKIHVDLDVVQVKLGAVKSQNLWSTHTVALACKKYTCDFSLGL